MPSVESPFRDGANDLAVHLVSGLRGLLVTRSVCLREVLHEQMAEAATDHARLADLNRELQESGQRKAELEDEWMRLAGDLDG